MEQLKIVGKFNLGEYFTIQTIVLLQPTIYRSESAFAFTVRS